ncbi:MAG: ATPase [Legionellales bacterium RIFCSPHIGHO2_12_FULL_37_14]|nr:MAG: ATPase [Legionellales bacterium RIFCSPHIGHO2_12_FULL_37_14]
MQSLIQILIAEFQEKIFHLQNTITRKASFPKVDNKIKVAIGMRRTGKTVFIFQQISNLLQTGVSLSEILYINFEDDRLLSLTRNKLSEILDSFYSFYPENHQKKCYFFLDEIQNVEDWPIIIRRFFDTKLVDIYLTGSSAKLLSKEIATSLRGRSLSVEIWPFDFNEYLQAKDLHIDRTIMGAKTKDLLNQMLDKYLLCGGFPEVTNYESMAREQTLQEYVTVVTYRDIVERYQITHPAIVKYMIITLISNVASPFSINKFYNDLKSQGYKIGKDSLYEYTQYIEDVFLVFFVPLYSTSIRKVHTNPKKIYAIDPGLVRAMCLNYEQDFGHLFENLVYLDLRRKGYKVYYYLTKERYEVDFFIENTKGKQSLIQVVWDTSDRKTQDREERALSSAMQELKVSGYLVTKEMYLQGNIPY